MDRPRVAITGLGLMTGLGLDLESSWRGLVEGRSPIASFTLFDAAGLGAGYGVELPAGADELFAASIQTRRRTQMTRATMITVVTAGMALADSGLDLASVDRARVGVVVGSTGTGYVGPTGGADPDRILRNMPNAPASWISLTHKLGGPAFIVSTACSSGAYALGSAFGLLAAGVCDVVVAGAADSSLNRLDVQGFGSLLALSENADPVEEASRPFDAARDGFVMGEGGGFLVLERRADAAARGARVVAELSLPGLTSEAYNIMSPARDGVGMVAAMRLALAQAGLTADDIDYVNAHGTSTKLNDEYETRAIKAVFGPRSATLPVSATKSMTGHCLAGAAGVEAVICCQAIAEGVIPPTANLTRPGDGLDLDYVPRVARRADLRHVMCNSFAFGGHNGVVVLSRPA
jgi:3-oxoacyl-[acyl-carrier-protein] synthase II